jgi:hypothetical protein
MRDKDIRTSMMDADLSQHDKWSNSAIAQMRNTLVINSLFVFNLGFEFS